MRKEIKSLFLVSVVTVLVSALVNTLIYFNDAMFLTVFGAFLIISALTVTIVVLLIELITYFVKGYLIHGGKHKRSILQRILRKL